MQLLRDLEVLVARILVAAIFIWSGLQKLQNPPAMADYLVKMAGIPRGPAVPLIWVSLVIELGCSILLILGLRVRIVAFILFLWLIPVTYLFHVSHGEVVEYLKNLCMMGGLLALSAYGAGRIGLDGERRVPI
ncbi:MAG TPA: DoxX family protein [Candidatus Binataceae bacterium]|nr:DoxX family protein [Candidatus Binataceae bacterium]